MKRGDFFQKKCTKCGGNIYLDADHTGWYEQCLQCGHVSYLSRRKYSPRLSKLYLNPDRN